MSEELSKSAAKIQDTLERFGFDLKVIELSDSTRTSQEAAEALGCDVAQIAKAIIFKAKESQRPILVIASGINRVNEKLIKTYTGEKIEKADAAFVLEQTGFVIGGIPPAGHKTSILTFIDEDLLNHEELWAAAGTPHAVFKLTPDKLLKLTNGKVVKVK
jgi:prolyl-tRNA editing enzyme YbaK/EbsC (Cys-tRNA(Pro) deacylase)